MPTNSEHIDRLISRVLAGEATDKELMQLNSWLDESGANKKYFGDIKFVYEKTAASHCIQKVDVNSAWEKVQRQMHAKKKSIVEVTNKTPFQVPAWVRIAAIFIIVSGFSLGFYRLFYMNKFEGIQTQTIASQDSVFSKKLADSTTVFLNRNSKITYASNYGSKERLLKLEGEAYFDVKHIAEKPFIVEAEGTLIQDIGTAFNIKAMVGDTLVEVYVKTGEVKFFTNENEGLTLTEGEAGVYNKKTRAFLKINSQVFNTISYTNRVFVFHNTRLSEVIQQLSSVYSVNITINSETIKDCTITVTFENEAIDLILNIVTETLNLNLIKTNDGYSIEGETCTNI